MNGNINTIDEAAPALPAEFAAAFAADDFSHLTLPGWVYNNAEFFELEKEYLFLSNWMLVCHSSEVAKPGDFATLHLLGERAFVMRGEDGELRAFYNVCRHRAAAVVQGKNGSCSSSGIRCPYHGWVYGLDGSLKAVPAEASFPGLKKENYGLKPLDIEICLGFVFVRFRSVGPSVAERLAPYLPELAPYRLEEMVPLRQLLAGRIRRRLEERRRQLPRRLSRAGWPSRALSTVRQPLRGRSARRLCFASNALAARQAVGQLERAALSATVADGGSSARRSSPGLVATTRCCPISASTSIRT